MVICSEVCERNFASLNSFGDPIIDKYFEIRECCCLFPSSFPLCTNPGPTFNTNNPKTDVVFVSFLHSKISSPQAVFFEILKPNIGELVTEKCPVCHFSRLKSVSLTANKAIFRAKNLHISKNGDSPMYVGFLLTNY